MPRLLATALGLVAVAALAFAATPASAAGNPKENAQDTRIQDLGARVDALLPLHPKLVFNTAGTFTADLIGEAASLDLGDFTGDGLAAGDAICQDEAEDAGLPLEFKAWLNNLSGPFVSARLTQALGGYSLVDDTPIATDFADLTDDNGISAPINLDAAGGASAGGRVWTNVLRDGGGSSGGSCSDWSSTGSSGKYGDSSKSDGGWTQSGADSCNTPHSLYCFQQ